MRYDQTLEIPDLDRRGFESWFESQFPGFEQFESYSHAYPGNLSLENNPVKNAGIKAIYANECSHVKVDMAFVRKIFEIENRFVTKKAEHIEFFGGCLTGVQVVRFTQEDMDLIFSELLMVDEHSLEDQIHDLPDIVPSRIVSSNIFNISCVWIMYAIENSPHLDDKVKAEAKIRIALYLNYRFLTSILYNFFKYPADPDIARATYAALSYRFILKSEGSWGKALRVRSTDLTGKSSIWYDVIKTLDDDYRVVKMLNDTQGRIKDFIKNIFEVHYRLHVQGSKISSTAATVEMDGETILKDRAHKGTGYSRYLRTVIPDHFSFVRQELLNIIEDICPTAPPRLIKLTLEWLSKNFSFIRDQKAENLVDSVMEHAIFYINENRDIELDKMGTSQLILKLRGAYTSSRSSDEKLMTIKSGMEDFVREATGTKQASVQASVRTAVCLYLVLRAFTRNYYSKK